MSLNRHTDLVFIYGPPAAGKYTIAKALTGELGWPLFHNHLAIDYVESLIKWGQPGFHEATADVRIALAEHALANGVSFVTTFVYAHGVDGDELFVNRLLNVAQSSGARVCPVQLKCAVATLGERCVAPHRAPMGKIATVEKLQSVLSEYDCFGAIRGVESFVVDSELHAVEQSVALVRRQFGI